MANVFQRAQELYGKLGDNTRRKIENFYWYCASNFPTDGEIQEVWEQLGEEGGIDKSEVEEYHNLFHKMNQNIDAVTIFVRDDKWLNDEPCVGWRHGTQYLPKKSWVIGFLRRGKSISLDVPYFKTKEAYNQFLEQLGNALLHIGAIEVDLDQLLWQRWATIG